MIMDFTTFQISQNNTAPPVGLSTALEALWLDGRGDWGAAHDRLQADHSPEGAWVHAYLHRKEGDASNAAYWYRRAGRPVASGPLEIEWEEIVRTLLTVDLTLS